MKIFWAFTRQAFQFASVYRFNFFVEIFLTFVRMYGIYWVWRILYTQKPDAFGVTMNQMITYGVLGVAMQIFMWSRVQWYIANQVKSGAIDTDLMKPMDFHIHMLARSIGETIIGSVLALPALIISYVFLRVSLPANIGTAAAFFISMLLGFMVIFHLNFILGTLAVFTLDIRHISWAYMSVIRFFGGQWVPLWLFPPVLVIIANFLPFQSTFAIPMSIYIGKIAGTEVIKALGYQFSWMVALVLCSRLLWTQAHRRLVVQGG
jgi:ABC-2 type transport system permease protein